MQGSFIGVILIVVAVGLVFWLFKKGKKKNEDTSHKEEAVVEDTAQEPAESEDTDSSESSEDNDEKSKKGEVSEEENL